MIFKESPSRRILDRLFRAELDQPRGYRRVLVTPLRFLYLGYREFRLDFCWERAATLAFVTILSLLPIAVLFLSVLSAFLTQERFQTAVKDLFLPFFLGDEALRGEVNKWVTDNISVDILQPGTGTGVAAIAGLVVAALALLVSSERVFNRIWKVRTTRNYFQKFVAFWIILTTSPLLVGVSFYVDSLSRAGTLRQILESYPLLGFLYGLLLPMAVSCSAFTLIYLFLPNTRVSLLAALLGGCVAGLLWEILKSGFYLYVGQASKLTSFYGSLGMVPIFLVFVYLTWLIILWGGELSYASQNYNRLLHDLRLLRYRESSVQYSPVFLGVYFLERSMRAYRAGEAPPSIEEVAGSLEIYSEEFLPVVRKLVETGVLVESSGSPSRLVPCKSPGTIRLRDVVEQLLPLAAREEVDFFPGKGGAGGSPAEVPARAHFLARRAYLESLGDRTLEDLAGEGPSLVAGPLEEVS